MPRSGCMMATLNLEFPDFSISNSSLSYNNEIFLFRENSTGTISGETGSQKREKSLKFTLKIAQFQ